MTTTFSFSFTLFLLQSLQAWVELINPWWRCADRGSAFLYTLIVPVRLSLRIILILRGVWVCVTELVTLDNCLLVSLLLWSCVPVCSRLVWITAIFSYDRRVEWVNVLCLQCCWLSQVLLNQLTAVSKTIPIKPDINTACWGHTQCRQTQQMSLQHFKRNHLAVWGAKTELNSLAVSTESLENLIQ